MNALAEEKSPYLLQHKNNPVDWRAWKEEVFDEAQRLDKPIFLSIGYSTCHWCHVMEKESFEDNQVATILNRVFIPVKVDREERPDIDRIYMLFCQMMSQRGGWPLTVFLSPQKKPFFVATYVPKHSRGGYMGLMELIPKVEIMWKEQRSAIDSDADKFTEHLRKISLTDGRGETSSEVLQKGVEQLNQYFDPQYGGFSQAPKFPSAQNLIFLAHYLNRNGRDESASDAAKDNDTQVQKLSLMLEKTLEQMRKGGIYDNIGFGFHRYATDAHWLLPHFEKMLYDQAMLLLAYSEAYFLTPKAIYKKTISEICDYVFRELLSPEGGFYSAEDADSEGEEGRFYVWEFAELEKILSKDELFFVQEFYGVLEGGNFVDEASRRPALKNILHLTQTEQEMADKTNQSLEGVYAQIGQIREKLFRAREKRIRPHKDDKILTDWNGLMIASLARTSVLMEESEFTEKYTSMAKKAADFIISTLKEPKGKLLHRFREGEAAIRANLDDYSNLIWGLVELYNAVFEVSYLEEALRLTDEMIDLFWDDDKGGFFFTPADVPETLVRSKEYIDGAYPSGNSVACYVLLKLGNLLGKFDYLEKATRLITSTGKSLQSSPISYMFLLLSLAYTHSVKKQLVILCPSTCADEVYKKEIEPHLSKIRNTFEPYGSVLLIPKDQTERYSQIAPYTKEMKTLEEKLTFYVCKNFTCNAPTTELVI